MKKISLFALSLLLTGCGTMDDLSESLKWTFATSYQFKAEGAAPKVKNNLFVNFSRDPALSSDMSATWQGMVASAFEKNGYTLAANEASALLKVNVSLQAVGPEYETRHSTENRLKECDKKTKECTYDKVQVTTRFSTCNYLLHITLKELNRPAGASQPELSIKTFWVKQKSRSTDGSAAGSLTNTVLLFVQNRVCNEEADELPKYLSALENVLSLSEMPQGAFKVLKKGGDFKIRPNDLGSF